MQNKKKGFTLVEIMIVVSIIAILLAISAPNFFKSRQNGRLQAIVANLRQIETAKDACAITNGATIGDTTLCTQSKLIHPSQGFLKKWPAGPITGTYRVNAVGTQPTFNSKTAAQWKAAPGTL